MPNIWERARGALDTLFHPGKMRQVNGYFKMLDGYTPIFTNYDGGVYEMELTRACIHAFANHCSKLQPNVEGADLRGLRMILEHKPNAFMTSSQFLYKTATIYEAQNTVFIVPIVDRADMTVGYYPVDPQTVEILDVDGKPWIRYTFRNNEKYAIELERCGVVSKYLYHNDIRGDSNAVLAPTMQLLATQNQGITEGIKNSASFRFMATLTNFVKPEDLKKEREKFVQNNFGPEAGQLALFPNTYGNVQQINSSAKVVEPELMKIIQDRVFQYFGTSQELLENKTFGDTWSAYYEGKIEPFAIQLSQAMTCMTFTPIELARGNAIVWSANRLQYMSSQEKLEVSAQMFDRGIMTTNQIMDIWNMPHVEGGDKRYIRREYAEIDKLGESEQEAGE